eukprot:5135090-Ditylum_brightwellii.AAC.1
MTKQKNRKVRRKRKNVICWGVIFGEGIAYTGSNVTEMEKKRKRKKRMYRNLINKSRKVWFK